MIFRFLLIIFHLFNLSIKQANNKCSTFVASYFIKFFINEFFFFLLHARRINAGNI